MKKNFLALVCFFHIVTAHSTTYYLSPTGSDNNNGTISAPFFTLTKAWTVITAGDIVYLRGGTYNYTLGQQLYIKGGTAGNLVKIWAYPGETPIITDNNSNYSGGDLIRFDGSYVHWKGIEIKDFSWSEPTNIWGWSAFRSEAAINCIFEQINYHHNRMSMTIRGSSTGNLVLNSDFHHNADPIAGYENADGFGFGITVNSGTPNTLSNTIRGCRAWGNADDGFDFWSHNGYVLIDSCWSFHNGYREDEITSAGNGNGFKLGMTDIPNKLYRTLNNCIASDNLSMGFEQAGNVGEMKFFNSAAYHNGLLGFNMDYASGSNVVTAKNCLAYANIGLAYHVGEETWFNTSTAILSNNNWQGNIVTNNSDFQSLNYTQMAGPRKANGSLPDITFLKPVTGSDLIDAGTNVGLPYNGSAPEIGFIETGSVAAPPNQVPVANAGTDQSTTLPISIVTLNGSGTDPDGTVTAYAWTLRSGPNTPALTGATTATLSVTNLVAGAYVFRLTVTDNGNATGYDEVNVIVGTSTTTNQAPVANAGTDKSITLPTNTIILSGSGTDADGSVASYAWTLRSGPNTPILAGITTTGLTVNSMVAGTYVFRLTVKDNLGLTGYDDVTVTVVANSAAKLINTSSARKSSGFRYYVTQNFGILPDITGSTTRSTLRIYENGIELKPPHSSHKDIATLGRGRFSHWGDRSFVVLYFSASDNTNPRTNGRTYTYTIQ